MLHKKGAHLPTWRRRVFVLRNGLLLWFRDEADAAARAASGGGSGRGPRGAFALAGFAAAREAPEVTKVSRSAARILLVVRPNTNYHAGSMWHLDFLSDEP